MTTGSDGRRSDMRRALRPFTLYLLWKFEGSIVNTFWEKPWTSKNVKSLISRYRKWRSKKARVLFLQILSWIRSENFMKIGWSIFEKTWQKKKPIKIIVKKKQSNNNKVFRWKRKTLIKKHYNHYKVFRWKRKTLIKIDLFFLKEKRQRKKIE